MNSKITNIIARLAAGEHVVNRESGNSMTPILYSRQPVTIAPVDVTKLEKGDILYVKVRGSVMTHKVYGLREGEVQIGNNHGHVNGWTKLHNVYGIVVAIEDTPIPHALKKVKTTP